MIRRYWSPRIGVAVGYLIVAIAFTWPLPLHFGSALTGDPGGDTGVYVWNQWVFQHEALVERRNPLATEQILSLTRRVNLSQHNYTAFLNLLALPLMPWLGVVATFNTVYVIVTLLTALATYALARRVTEATRLEAWVAGLAFAWSPALVARSTGHFSLVAAAPLPAFLMCFVTAIRTGRGRWAALAGLCTAWAASCDVYYAVYCLMMAGGYLLSRLVLLSHRTTPPPVSWRWTLDVLIVVAAGLVAGLLLGRGGRFEVFGIPVSISGLYTPVLLLTLLVIARVAITLQPHLAPVPALASRDALRLLAVAVIVCATALSPVLYGLGAQAIEGRLARPATLWRSSPPGVDLLAFVTPNPNHPLVRRLHDRQAAAPTVFVEHTAAFGLVALSVVVAAVWRRIYRPHAAWLWLTLGFGALALGPFVRIAGVNTHVPGPWALLRYLPLVGEARAPTRFAIVAALGLAILLAGALAALGERVPGRRRWVATLAGMALLFELFPAPRTLYSAQPPAFYAIVAADPRPIRVLELPFGVRDGVSSAGDFSARYQFHQTFHGKRLIGGYLSRISAKRVREVKAHPILEALLTLSEGGRLEAEHAARLRDGVPAFVANTNLGYILIDYSRAPGPLVDFVVDGWALEEIAREWPRVLYRPGG